MRRATIVLGLLLATALAAGWAASGPQQPEVDRDLEEAKGLYREAKFAQAIAKLQSAIGRLDQLRDLEARKIQLTDAYLHLALSYVALNDPTAAKETLKQMVRLDRSRRLDPEVYAPKVLELFEQARAEVAAEAPQTAQQPPPAVPPTEAKKKGSRLPYILLGAGGAAGGGIAAASGGGGTSTTTPPPAPAVMTTSSTTTSVPVSSGLDDIVFISSDPPPGATVSVGGGAVDVRIVLSVIYSRSGNYRLGAFSFQPADGSDWSDCIPGTFNPGFALTAGQPMTVELGRVSTPTSSCLSRLPVTTVQFTAQLNEGTGDLSQTIPRLRRIIQVGWTFVR